MAIDSWSKVRIYATWTNHLGALLPGTYLIRVPARLTNSADDIIIPAGIWAEGNLSTTSGSPSLSIPCPSTDDPDIQQDDWKLEVEINFTNGQRGEKYVLDVPIANRPVVDGGDGLGVNLRNIAISEYLPPQVAMYGVGRPKGLALLNDDGTAVVDADGNPIEATADWEGLTGKPSVIAAGADAGAARSAIGAASAEAVASKADLDSGTGKLAASQLPTVPVDNLDAVAPVKAMLAASDAAGARAGIGAEVVDRVAYHASNHGVVGDGTTDDSTAFQSLLNSAATFGLTAMLAPASTVRCVSAITLPSGCRLDLNGSVVKNASPSTSGRVINIVGASNVWVGNGVIDGDKASFASATEQRHNIRIVNSSRVTLENLVSRNAKGDGIYIGDDVAGISSDIVLDRVTCDGNHRQGMSVSAVDGLKVISCRFVNTSGTNPQSGVDIEPNTDTAVIRGIVMVGCVFGGNAHDGLLVSTRATPSVEQSGGVYIGCEFVGNANRGFYSNNATDVKFVGGKIAGNALGGVWNSTSTGGLSSRVSFTDVEISGNGGKGVLTDNRFDDWSFTNCRIINNTGIGMDFSPGASSSRLAIIGTTSGNTGSSTAQTHGVRTGANVARVTLMGNSYPSNATAEVSLSDDIGTRLRFDLGVALDSRGATTGTVTYSTRVAGDAQPRGYMRGDGALYWGDGASAVDTNLYRSGADKLRTDDMLIATLGIGVGNSVAATTPGSVVRKLEVFSASGASLGFIPIYSSIS